MDAIVELIGQYGVMGGMFFAAIWWFTRQYLPEHDRQRQAELARIISAHEQAVERLAAASERHSRVLQYNSQALLAQGFMRGGLTREEAEQLADSVRVGALDGWPVAGE